MVVFDEGGKTVVALVLSGAVAALAPDDEQGSFTGRVCIGDDGLVEAVTHSATEAMPAGFEDAPVVEVDGVIYPGFIDLHSHVAYNTLPLWSDPARTKAYAHHDSWPGGDSYRNEITWPAWTLLNAAPESVLAYVQVRALAGGTTSIQGWPSLSRSAANPLVRSIDNEQIGPLTDPVVVSALTLDSDDLRKRAGHLKVGRSFIYHCAEGAPGSVVADEFEDLVTNRCVKPGLIAIHCTALDAGAFKRWGATAPDGGDDPVGAVVWSPFSNLWLYGVTTDVPAALENNVAVCLGTDWGPSGTKNLLGELKVARAWSDAQDWGLSDHDLVRMITANPGDALSRAWRTPAGRLVAGGLGDVVVLAKRDTDPWTNVVRSRERDVELVIVGGRPHYGTKSLMQAAGAGTTTSVKLAGTTRHFPLVLPDGSGGAWAWSEVLAGLDAVRADAKVNPPKGPAASRGGDGAGAGEAGVGDPPGTPRLDVGLDMPGTVQETAGPPPPGRTVNVPPIDSLDHSPAWLKTLKGRGFHGGALDGLAEQFG